MKQDTSTLHLFDENQRWKLMIDAMADYAIYMLNVDGKVASWNSGAEKIKGYKADEIIGQHFSIFYTPEDRQAGLPHHSLDVAQREGRWEAEGWRVCKDGRRFWAVIVIDPIRDENGTLLGFTKITRDITERVRAHRELMESERRFRLFVQSVTDYAIFMLDPDGYITNWNAGAQRIKGYTEEEAVGRHFSCFYTEEDRALGIPLKSLQTAKNEGKYDAEGWRIRKDGSYFRAHVVIDPVYDTDGTLIGYAKITRDITERRKTESDLQETRDALFQAQKMEAVGQLTGGLAHDFNNLLTVIVNSLEILSRRTLDERETRLLNNARLAASRGAKLTNQLLAFSRRQALAPDIHDINRLIAGFDSVLRGASGATVELQFELAEKLALTKVDSAQFESALLNLVVNARDAMPDGGKVRIETADVQVNGEERNTIGPLKPGHYVSVTVTDQGTGIPADLLQRIFEPFFTTKAMGKGTGLGLSQVYGFARQSEGGIEVVRSDATGTCIRLYLPATQEVVVAGKSADTEAQVSLSGMLVLVVEDEQEVRESAVAILETLGCTALVAENAEEAEAVLQKHANIDVLFSDIVFRTGVDGFVLARNVREKYPDIGIILTSGHPGKLSIEQKMVEGAQFIPKPYRLEDLARRLETLDKRK
ncbi:PAS domain S-box protein [Microvirga sp. W0021]|uniref:histidine kinase n=1 Tax=Hohaiivirga grylli TaxID=3133970 RepID=A0ABV0BFU2_9HYPH